MLAVAQEEASFLVYEMHACGGALSYLVVSSESQKLKVKRHMYIASLSWL